MNLKDEMDRLDCKIYETGGALGQVRVSFAKIQSHIKKLEAVVEAATHCPDRSCRIHYPPVMVKALEDLEREA